MHYRSLGKTGVSVSEIGFGAWGIGGDAKGSVAYGATKDDESLAALSRAFDLGINFFDTADLYGMGHSDTLLGEAFGGRRDKVILASKVGFSGPDGSRDFSPAHIRESLEGSLRRLRTDHIDLYQLHDPHMDWLEKDEKILQTMQSLRKEGKTRAVGISLRSPDDGCEAIARFKPDCIQVNFNLVDQRARENGLLECCEKSGVGCIIRTPLCFGFLSGEVKADSVFAASDHRSRWSREQLALWAKAPEQFRAMAQKNESTLAQLSLRFCLSYPGVSTTIPGMLNGAQVEENSLASGQGPLEDSDREALEKIYQQNVFFLSANRR